MSQQNTPGPPSGGAPGLSRIPTLSAVRSGASSRLPSPPISPGLSSPSTPQDSGHYPSGSTTWTAGMLAHARERLAQAGSGGAAISTPYSSQSMQPIATTAAANGAGAAATPSASAFATPPAATVSAIRQSYSHSRSSSLSLSRGFESVRTSAPGLGPGTGPGSGSGLGRPPPTPLSTSGLSPPTGGGLNFSPRLAGTGGQAGLGSGGGGVQDAGLPSPAMTSLASSVALPGFGGVGAAAAAAGSGEGSGGGGAGAGTSRSNVQVAVRLRPLCEKERLRGDRAAWAADREGNVGLVDSNSGAFTPKHRFDTVFGPEAGNTEVACSLALPLVGPALGGVNGTIFAYGVTSSGKTHTMMGADTDPGIVPRVVRELFSQIAAAGAGAGAGAGPGQAPPSPGAPRSFSVRMSIMEIYNEILNDLLDPSRANLKVREDARSGLVVVEGLTEQPVSCAEQALDLIHRGDHNRKVSATAFNEDSSRSHTITRIIVESAALPYGDASGAGAASDAPPRPVGRRTTACLCLIDLAGSESARAVVSKGQRMEGSYINRSLLTLGTVIHKLAAGSAGHVPFRDSKLTRLLQPSLSGPGARVAVVCNVTPAAGQSDETANTLKFAARAKLVQVTARANEILDERTLLRRYQKEVADLKRQLAEARRLLEAAGIATGGMGGSAGGGEGMEGGEVLGLGLEDGAAAAAALRAERDARQVAEMEAVMLRMKLARVQAFLEERGLSLDGPSTPPPEPSPEPATSAPLRKPSSGHLPPTSHLRRSTSQIPDASPILSPTGGGAAANGNAAVSPTVRMLRGAGGVGSSFNGRVSVSGIAGGGRGALRYAASSPRLSVEGGSGGGGGGSIIDAVATSAAGTSGGGGRSRTSYAGSDATSEAAAAPATAVVGVEGGSLAVAEAGSEAGAAMSPAALRAQVAAALRASGAARGGGSPSGSCGDGGSEEELEEDLNDGLMAQIRDMISEAQLTAPDAAAAAAPQLPPRARTSSEGGGASGASGAAAITPAAGGRPLSTSSGTIASARNPASSQAVLVPQSSRSTMPGSAGGIGGGRPQSGGAASSSSLQRRSLTLSPSSSYAGGLDLDLDLELQVLNADREVLHDQLVASEAAVERLTTEVTDLRRQLGTYEKLTRQAAGELVEIRRLKEAFQSRLQRENEALRTQLAHLGVQPVVTSGAPSGGGAGAASPHLQARQQHYQQQQQALNGGGEGLLRRPQSFGGIATGAAGGSGGGGGSQLVSAFEAAASAAAANGRLAPPLSPQPLRYGVQSMAPFGSPAATAGPPAGGRSGTATASSSSSNGGLWQAGGTPTRTTSSFAASASAAAAARQPQRSSGIPGASVPPLSVSLAAAAAEEEPSVGLQGEDRSVLSPCARAAASDRS